MQLLAVARALVGGLLGITLVLELQRARVGLRRTAGVVVDQSLLDVLGECDEGLVDVDAVLCTRLHELDAVLVCQRLALFGRDHL